MRVGEAIKTVMKGKRTRKKFVKRRSQRKEKKRKVINMQKMTAQAMDEKKSLAN